MIRFMFYFTLSFLILSLPVKEKPTFYYLENVSKPYTSKVFQKIGNFFDRGADVAMGIFMNSAPKQDVVQTKQSAISKKKVKIENVHNEKYTDEEKELLKRVLEEAHKKEFGN